MELKGLTTSSLEEAHNIIDKNEHVVVVWFDENCPSCSQLVPIMQECAVAPWELVLINTSKPYTDGIDHFYPDKYPSVYIFKNKKRMFVTLGAAPKDVVETTLSEILNGTFKTAAEHEQEMLDALD
jgi:thioredoxin-like negative regulator of GroEL